MHLAQCLVHSKLKEQVMGNHHQSNNCSDDASLVGIEAGADRARRGTKGANTPRTEARLCACVCNSPSPLIIIAFAGTINQF